MDNYDIKLMLMYRIEKGDCPIEFFRKLVDKGIDINYETRRHSTFLMIVSRYANRGDNQEIAQLLINMGAEIDLQDNHGFTALYMAARYSSMYSTESMVKMLIDAGANLELKSLRGTTALLAATMGATDHPFRKTMGTINTMRMLIEAGAANIEKGNVNGYTALMEASCSSKHGARMLIDAGADIHQKDHSGKTALTLAVKYCVSVSSTETITMLIEANY